NEMSFALPLTDQIPIDHAFYRGGVNFYEAAFDTELNQNGFGYRVVLMLENEGLIYRVKGIFIRREYRKTVLAEPTKQTAFEKAINLIYSDSTAPIYPQEFEQ